MPMFKPKTLYSTYLLIGLTMLACQATATPITPMPPRATVAQISFDIQTATATVAALVDLPTYTPTPFTPTATPVIVITATAELTNTAASENPTNTPMPEPAAAPATEPPPPTNAPVPAPTATPAPPLAGGEWDFEAGFSPWTNPHGDQCAVGALAVGWQGFTSRDQYGSSCLNKNDYPANVYTGQNVQEITFAFVGNEAGIYKTFTSIPNRRYRLEAYVKREKSDSPTESALGVDLGGGGDWQAATVQWFPWREQADDAWAKTTETVTATGENITIFIKGHHPLPVVGGALRIDNVSVTDMGVE